MIMMDASNGKVAGSVPIGKRVDANAFDPGTQLAFASCGDGTVTIAHEDAPDKLAVVQTLKTQRGARTMTIDTKTHKIYLSQGDRNTPDSFKVLVYECSDEGQNPKLQYPNSRKSPTFKLQGRKTLTAQGALRSPVGTKLISQDEVLPWSLEFF